jgi:4-hydroxythreonine-4-phosphate dehydrogenase
MNRRIGIALGDVTGIGPEVTLKAVASDIAAGDTRYLVIGDIPLLRTLHQRLGLRFDLTENSDSDAPIAIRHTLPGSLPPNLPPGAPDAARAAVAWLEEGARLCLRGELAALVTAPVNKESIIASGQSFVGQTEFLGAMAGNCRTVMMLLGHDDRQRWLRVALATTHLPLRRVADALTQPAIELAIELASKACGDIGLPRARVGVCGLNPHAGEGGQFGDEEITTVGPAVRAAQKRGMDVSGPWAADSLFYYAFRGDYDAVVAMYHDQGLAPLKMIGFETGVNWTLGLPFVRTSPDHGTAYDIAGRGIANPSSMCAAMKLARQLTVLKPPSPT